MVKQGDIIQIDFNPVRGHEQGKTRPAIVISSNSYNNKCGGLVIVCPISHANEFPTHIKLPEGMKTDGKILCQHVRTVDVGERGYTFIEKAPKEIVERTLRIVMSALGVKFDKNNL